MSTIPKGSTVLVTGVNGFIGSHIADHLLAAGYSVRGTVRSISKADWLYRLFDEKYGQGFEAIEVPDMSHDGAFDEAVRGVSGICHLASVLSFSANPDEVIPASVKGTLGVLTSATKERSVKSLVFCSSSAAVLYPQPNTPIKITKDTWNDAAVHIARTNPDPFSVYAASKIESERAVWKAVQEANPPFQVAVVLPNFNIGTILRPGGDDDSSTASLIISLTQGVWHPAMMPQWFVNVDDDAKLHVAALTDPSCNGQRIFAFAEPFNGNDVLAAMRKLYPGHQFIEDREDQGRDLSEIPNKDAEALLIKHYGKGWTSLEESVRENLATLNL